MWSEDGVWDALSFPTSSGGIWEILLDTKPRAGVWNVAIVKGERRLSEIVPIVTTAENCHPEGNGHQVAIVDFMQQSSVDYKIITQRMLSMEENGGDPQVGGCGMNHLMYITVIDINGNPLDGVVVRVGWPNEYADVVTGEKGPGRVEFPMYGNYQVRVVSDVSGRVYSSETTRWLDSRYPTAEDLKLGGYCPGMTLEECAELRDRGPGYLCYGHYSYEIVFQRQW